MRRNSELDGDFLGRQMLVDQPETVQLALAQLRHAIRDLWLDLRSTIIPQRGIRHPSISFQLLFCPDFTTESASTYVRMDLGSKDIGLSKVKGAALSEQLAT
jgi:hypothetical protein